MENISKYSAADDKKNSAVKADVQRARKKWRDLVQHGIGYKVGSSVAFNDSLCRGKPEVTSQERA